MCFNVAITAIGVSIKIDQLLKHLPTTMCFNAAIVPHGMIGVSIKVDQVAPTLYPPPHVFRCSRHPPTVWIIDMRTGLGAHTHAALVFGCTHPPVPRRMNSMFSKDLKAFAAAVAPEPDVSNVSETVIREPC